jgi:hypothetical protein
MLTHRAWLVVVLVLLQLSCGGRNVPVLDAATDGIPQQPDSGSGPDNGLKKDMPSTDARVNHSLYAAFFVHQLFADCMPSVPPDPVSLTGHAEFLNNGSIPVGPIQFTGAKIVALTGEVLYTFDVKPIASFVIKPGEGLSPQVEKVADSLKPAGACSLCGTSIRVTLGYTGAGIPAGATITSADVALSCAY